MENSSHAAEKETRQYFTTIVKRDNRVVLFDKKKIADAIFKAAFAVGGEDRAVADELASAVTLFLYKQFGFKSPSIEEIQDIVEKVLIETGHAKTAKAYILYRQKRAESRANLKVRKPNRGGTNSTDISLLVTPLTKDEILPWDKIKVSLALQKEAEIDAALADEVASSVEKKIFSSEISQISTSLIRELVNNELFSRGLGKKLARQASMGVPLYDLETLIFSKSQENANINANNPEAINLSIAETVLKQYALQRIFSPDIADAHMKGEVHLHDLGYPTRVYCSSHSLEYIKKYGLHLRNLDTQSAPAKHARTLTGHLNTFLASMQAYYAGALGVGYINIFYAPYLEGVDDKEMLQEAQHLIFSASQNAFSRGGQSLFTDHNIHTGIPNYLKEIPAIGPNGKPTGKTYGEYEDTARRFAMAMLHVWRAGDENGKPFAFPKCLDKDTMLLPRINGMTTMCTAEEISKIKLESPDAIVELPNFNLETKMPEWVRLKDCMCRGEEKGIAVTLPNKIVIKTTADHPHVVLKKEGLAIKEAAQLCVGDVLLYKSPGHILYSEQKVIIDVLDIFKKANIKCQVYNLKNNPSANKYARIKGWADISEVVNSDISPSSYLTTYKQKNHAISTSFCLDENWAKLLGYFTAEGSYQQIAISVTQSENNSYGFFQDIKATLEKINISYRFNRKKGETVGLIFGGRLHKELFKALMPGYSKNSSTKEVPNVIFASPISVQKAFLQGLFNGDGTTKGSSISYATKSKKLAYGVQILLSKMGIYSTIYNERIKTYPENIYYHVAIKGRPNISEALDILRNEKFSQYPKDAYFGNMIDIAWYNHIPTALLEREDFKNGEKWKLKRHNYICRGTLVNFPHALLLEHLVPMPVTKIEETAVDAYALEVEGAQHTFMTADGILTHNCDLHISEETFKDPDQRKILDYACQIASENGSPYFVFDRDEVTLSACCRLRTQIKDNYMIEHPESMRFCGFQNITINLPQAAYRAGRSNIDGFYKEVGRCMDIAIKAHLQKKDFIWKLMSEPSLPMWEVGKLALDGRPYIDLDKATYIIGLLGLNECTQYLVGKQLHEDEDVFKLGLKIISFMYFKAKEAEKKLGIKFSLEESPAESAARRLAKVDMRQFLDASAVIKGDVENDMYYYTNSIHFAANAPIDIVTRIQKQSKFHTMIESGAIIHAFVGERLPSKDSIMNLVEKTYYNTQAAQITISPEFTICNSCSKRDNGLHDTCRFCNSDDTYGMTRIVGYYSRVNNWNKSKLGELADRRSNVKNYAIA